MQFSVSLSQRQLSETMFDIQRFWDLDTLGITSNENSALTMCELEAQKMQDAVTRYDVNKKTWFTSLLFKKNPPELGSNKLKALAVMKKVEATAIRKGCQAELNAAFQEFLDMEFAEEVHEQEEPSGEVHYLPAFAVFREESVTTRIRLVFNASSKSETGNSLNECLYQGPCLLPDIVGVLVRFRLKIVGYALDISKMFLRIKLDTGKDYLRFLWRFCDTEAKVRVFRMLVVTFGIVSSPFQAGDIVLKNADEFQELYPRAAATVRSQCYMDDVPSSADSLDEAKLEITELMNLFGEATMQAHKFTSNAASALANVPEQFRAQGDTHKILGLMWNTGKDRLHIKSRNPELDDSSEQPLTPRIPLGWLATIFDPLGFAAPL